jgi:hypothetical protein
MVIQWALPMAGLMIRQGISKRVERQRKLRIMIQQHFHRPGQYVSMKGPFTMAIVGEQTDNTPSWDCSLGSIFCDAIRSRVSPMPLLSDLAQNLLHPYQNQSIYPILIRLAE